MEARAYSYHRGAGCCFILFKEPVAPIQTPQNMRQVYVWAPSFLEVNNADLRHTAVVVHCWCISSRCLNTYGIQPITAGGGDRAKFLPGVLEKSISSVCSGSPVCKGL